MRDIIKGSFVILIFKIFGAFAMFLTYILIPRYYGVELFGIFNLIFSILMIATVISRVGLDTYVLRIVSATNDAQEISLFLKNVLKILLISSLAVGFILFLFSDFINQHLFKSIDASRYIIGLILIILPYTFFNVVPEVFRGLDNIKFYSFFRNFLQNFTVALLLSVSIFATLNYDPIYLLYSAILIISFISFITIFYFLRRKNINLLKKGKYDKKILIHSYPMLLASSIIFLMSYVDSFMISYYLNEYQVGIYNACINLSMLLTFIPLTIGGFISPKISQAYSNNNHHQIKEIFKHSILISIVVTLPMFMMLYFYAEFFLNLFGSEFTIATTTLLITNIAFLSEVVCGPVGFILNMTDNQHIFMKVLMIALFINILLNAILIPSYGISGAAIAMMFSMFFWRVSSLIILKRKAII